MGLPIDLVVLVLVLGHTKTCIKPVSKCTTLP